MHGWYSKKHFFTKQNHKEFDGNGNFIYEHLYYIDINDNEVEVTMVSDTIKHRSLYNDLIYVGELKYFSRISKKVFIS
tara:strand:+ start:2332 stop:2565 length:234 start_codon:yes stop_codon:yes gene_type:complete